MKTLLFASILLTVPTWTLPARANCAMPTGYTTTVSESTVIIDAVSHGARGCPDPEGMLRQDVATGEVVRLADFCVHEPGTSEEASGAYQDECVPPGTYRYGFAAPYECCSSCCGTYYFEETTVDAALDPGCQRSPLNAAPVPATSVPWTEERMICGYGSIGAGKVGSGCSTVPSGAGTVLAIDAFALALGGAALLRVRRRKP